MNKLIYTVYIALFVVNCAGGILNGSFELYDPNGGVWFDSPVDWEYESYAGIQDSFVSQSSTSWSVPPAVDGEYFCLLSTGDTDISEDEDNSKDSGIVHSYVQQQITLDPGDFLEGAYFFGTYDWAPYLDEGHIYLAAVDPNTEPNSIELVYITVADVGNYRAMEDWKHFSYTYTGRQTRDFYLICEVKDILDNVVASFLAVDDLSVCKVSKDRGDLNGDCQVNMEDFYILSTSWLCYYDPNDLSDPNEWSDPNSLFDPNSPSDPNSFFDPNSPCPLADIDGNYSVDSGDLRILMDWWLFPSF